MWGPLITIYEGDFHPWPGVIHLTLIAFELVQSNVQFCKHCGSFDQLWNSLPAPRTTQQIHPHIVHYSHSPDKLFFLYKISSSTLGRRKRSIDPGCCPCRAISQFHLAHLVLRILDLQQIKTSSSGILLTSLSVLPSGDLNLEMSSAFSNDFEYVPRSFLQLLFHQ